MLMCHVGSQVYKQATYLLGCYNYYSTQHMTVTFCVLLKACLYVWTGTTLQ